MVFHYVGPDEIKQAADYQTPRTYIDSRDAAYGWLIAQSSVGRHTATFIIDLDQRLWIADQHSEHVAYARGQAVLAAGEITFELENRIPYVFSITNQSTGYCPTRRSWEIVEKVLQRIEIDHPSEFTMACQFRRCNACGQRNIIKDDWFVCGVCGSDLPEEWNFHSA